jgi:DNA-directed RNA polymerase subunit RPC12/RpoP
MSIMRACKCPNCGANLSFDDTSRDYAFCEYCGAKIDLMDKRTYHTEHIIDEAKIKNAENISRIVNIFAAPVEEKQRQKEFERQQQAEAARREYERQKRKDEEARENREAMEDGCAAAMSGCLVKCAKHPIIALVIAIAMLGSCMGSDSSSSSSTSSKSQSTTISASSESELEMYSDKYIATTKYSYDIAYTRISEDGTNTRYYYLVDHSNHVVAFVTSKNNTAMIGSFQSGDLSTGISITWQLPVTDQMRTPFSRKLQYTNPENDKELLSIEEDGESNPFVKASLDAAEKALYQSDKIYDYSS